LIRVTAKLLGMGGLNRFSLRAPVTGHLIRTGIAAVPNGTLRMRIRCAAVIRQSGDAGWRAVACFVDCTEWRIVAACATAANAISPAVPGSGEGTRHRGR
jgi:hypothetical protein